MPPVPGAVLGLPELQKALADLPKATQRSVQQRVLMKHAKPIVAAARATVQVDKGRVRSSIIATTKRPPGYKTRAATAYARTLGMGGSVTQAQAAAKTAGADPVTVYIISSGHGRNPVDMWLEFGTKKSRPYPFMRPAVNLGAQNLGRGVAQDMWDEIQKSVQRITAKQNGRIP